MSSGRRRTTTEVRPTTSADVSTPIAPSPPGRRARRRAAQEAARDADRARNRRAVRRYGVPALIGVVVLLLVVGLVYVVRGSGPSKSGGATAARTQKTLLVQLVPVAGKPTVADALLASDSASGQAVVLTVPGRLIVPIGGGGRTTFDQSSVTADGPTAASALGDQLGVIVDGSWVLTESTLATLVDKVGGVTVDVDTDVTGKGPGGNNVILVPQGNAQHLNGAQAAAFAGYLASGEPEAARLARFTAVWREMLSGLPDDPAAVQTLLAGTTGSVSSLPPAQLAAYLVGLHQAVASDSVAYPTLPTVVIDSGAATSYRLDTAKTATLVAQQFAGSRPATPPGGATSVLVQNGVGTPGLVDATRSKLQAAGLTFEAGGNAARFGYSTSVILIPDSSAASIAKGDEVAKALGLPLADVKISAQGQSVADVLVILGSDFHG